MTSNQGDGSGSSKQRMLAFGCIIIVFLIGLNIYNNDVLSNISTPCFHDSGEVRLSTVKFVSTDSRTGSRTVRSSSYRSDRKAYAFSLIDNKKDPGRFERLDAAWTKAYPELEIEKIDTMESLRGLSLIFSSFEAIQQAIVDDVEYAIILEDDALPFTIYKNFEKKFNETLKAWPKHSPVMFIGAHHIRSVNKLKAAEAKESVVDISFAYGTYAYVIRRPFFSLMSKYFQSQARKVTGQAKSPDVAWWSNVFLHPYTPAYVTLPLLVDHVPGFSATWNRKRSDSWNGKPKWWELKYDSNPGAAVAIPGYKPLCEELKRIENSWTGVAAPRSKLIAECH